MTVDFKQALSDAGIPTTEEGLRQAWESEVAAQGSALSNTSAYSPFWRIVTALVTKPVLWLITFISGTVLRVDGARPQVRMGWGSPVADEAAQQREAIRPFDGFHRAATPKVFGGGAPS